MDSTTVQEKSKKAKIIILCLVNAGLIVIFILLRIYGLDPLLGGKFFPTGVNGAKAVITKMQVGSSIDISLLSDPKFKNLKETPMEAFNIKNVKLGKTNPFSPN